MMLQIYNHLIYRPSILCVFFIQCNIFIILFDFIHAIHFFLLSLLPNVLIENINSLQNLLMKNLSFHLSYYTDNGAYPELAYSVDNGPIVYLPLRSDNQGMWITHLEVPDNSQQIRYAYQIIGAGAQLQRTEQNTWRLFHFNHRTNICFVDAWADNQMSEIYHRTAFEHCIMLPRGGEQLHMDLLSSPCLLLLHALPPTDGLRWAVVGSTPNWGKWQLHEARLMQRTGTYEWALPLSRDDFEQGVEYKYVLLNTTQLEASVWEQGGNRIIMAMPCDVNASIVRQDEMPHIDLKPWRGAGCVMPVFSLRSKGSMGVGDFADLLTFIRWAAETGMKAVQLLPINDTTRTGGWRDSYPYNGISVFALHPIYLDLREWKNSQAYKQCEVEGARLNALPDMDYEGVFKLKMQFAHTLYDEMGARTLASSEYKLFASKNKRWLPAYTAFCALRDTYHTADFRSWPADAPTPDNIDNFTHQHPHIKVLRDFYGFLQYLLHRQMLQVHEAARQLGVMIKGDIPIGISRDSVPAWVDNRLFHFNGQAGAPPDDFAVHGQNWGFPTYNWEEMAKDGYAWWRERLQHMEQYFDAYRIDHVLGFFRIWEVPTTQIYGVLGHFRPALPFTETEIHNYGFTGNVAAFCVPRVTRKRMQQLVNDLGDAQFATQYFDVFDEESYCLKPTYCSQRAIERLFPEGKTREVLLEVACEVLFIHDSEHPQLYHPRVSAQLTQLFQSLTSHERDAFNRLHDDFFYHRNNQFWADEAMKKVPAVTHSFDLQHPLLRLYPLQGDGMLPCAEDLGMVPASVKGVLERLQILSLEIQRMPKEYGVRFGNVAHNPYLSVATIATHDMPPLRLWWQQNEVQRQAFWTDVLGQTGQAPADATPEVCEAVVKLHLQSPSMLCLLAFQDWLSISSSLRSKHPENEQINVPANPNQYWRYRMHLTLDDLLQASGFNDKLRALIAECR